MTAHAPGLLDRLVETGRGFAAPLPSVLVGDKARHANSGEVFTSIDSSAEEALKRADALPLGLAAGIQTRNIDRVLRLARRARSDSVWINGWLMGGFQASTGGVKDSGFGRVLGLAGIRNYLGIKNTAVHLWDTS